MIFRIRQLFLSTNVVKRGKWTCNKSQDVKKQGEERKINLLFSLFDVLIRSAIVIIKWMNKLSDAGIKSNKAITMVNIRLKHPLEN